jgi:hypothetical protein
MIQGSTRGMIMSNLAKNDFHAISFVHAGVEVGRTNLFSVFSIKLLLPQRRIPLVAADALPLSLSLAHSLTRIPLLFPSSSLFRALPDNVFRRGTK